jgi:hypothetical protein
VTVNFQNHSKYDRHGSMVLPWANMQPSFLRKWDEPSMLRALLAKHPLVSRSPAPWSEIVYACELLCFKGFVLVLAQVLRTTPFVFANLWRRRTATVMRLFRG